MRTIQQLTSEEVKTIKIPLKKAFHLLRTKHNITARMNFSCCGNCGSYELGEIVKEKKLDGYVFYHHQDEDNFKEGGDVYLRYGKGVGAITAHGVGRLIVSVCKEVGLQTDWDGTDEKCILVKGTEYLEQWRKDEERRQKIGRIQQNIKLSRLRTERYEESIISEKDAIIALEKELEELKNETSR